MKSHKRALFAAASVVALGIPSHANAADLALPPVSPSWTGFYGAAGIGGRFIFTDVSLDEIVEDTKKGTTDISNLGALDNFGEPGVFGTVELGYDMQMPDSGIVLGVVGNFDFGDAISTVVSKTSMGTTTQLAEWEIGNSWGIGARAGVLANQSTLIYGIGGFTQADISTSVSDGDMKNPLITSDSDWQSGFFVGAGVETMLSQNIAAKLEYRYANYGGASAGSDPVEDMGKTTFSELSTGDIDSHSVRASLVWRFGGVGGDDAGASVVPSGVSYPASPSWSGLYAAAGLGGRFIFTDVSLDEIVEDTKKGTTDISNLGVLDNFGEPDVFGTVELGYDRRLDASNFVVGVVGNFDFTDGVSATISKTSMGTTTQLAEWDIGSSWGIGARAGVLATDTTLFYGVAGFSQADISTSVSDGDMKNPLITSDSDWQAGYFVGAGVETALTSSIAAKLEYRYANYGGASASSDPVEDMGKTTFNELSTGDIDSHSVRGTLVWRFDTFGN